MPLCISITIILPSCQLSLKELAVTHVQEIQNWLHANATGATPRDGYTGSNRLHLETGKK